MNLSSKQRAYLKGLAQNIDPVFQIGKSELTPEVTDSVSECFNTKELIKGTVQKNCMADLNEMANTLADRTRSTLVQVIGRKIVLYKPFHENPEIKLPR